jgi:hypothetical protein
MAEECPEVCQLILKTLGDNIVELKEEDKDQWAEIAKRPKLGPLLWFTGITVLVLGALLGAIYAQGVSTHKDVVGLQIQAERIETQIDNHERARNRSANSLRDNKDGG